MPADILATDTLFPDLSGNQTVNEKFEMVTDYLFLLREQLTFTLANLGVANFNASQLKEFTGLINEPIQVALEEQDEKLLNLVLSVDGLSGEISSLADNAVKQTDFTITTDGISLLVGENTVDLVTLSKLTATSSALSGEISTATQDVVKKSAFNFTSDGLVVTIDGTERSLVDAEGVTSVINNSFAFTESGLEVTIGDTTKTFEDGDSVSSTVDDRIATALTVTEDGLQVKVNSQTINVPKESLVVKTSDFSVGENGIDLTLGETTYNLVDDDVLTDRISSTLKFTDNGLEVTVGDQSTTLLQTDKLDSALSESTVVVKGSDFSVTGNGLTLKIGSKTYNLASEDGVSNIISSDATVVKTSDFSVTDDKLSFVFENTSYQLIDSNSIDGVVGNAVTGKMGDYINKESSSVQQTAQGFVLEVRSANSSGTAYTRAKLSSDGLTLYNSAGATVFSADASGNLTISGNFVGSTISGSTFSTTPVYSNGKAKNLSLGSLGLGSFLDGLAHGIQYRVDTNETEIAGAALEFWYYGDYHNIGVPNTTCLGTLKITSAAEIAMECVSAFVIKGINANSGIVISRIYGNTNSISLNTDGGIYLTGSSLWFNGTRLG